MPGDFSPTALEHFSAANIVNVPTLDRRHLKCLEAFAFACNFNMSLASMAWNQRFQCSRNETDAAMSHSTYNCLSGRSSWMATALSLCSFCAGIPCLSLTDEARRPDHSTGQTRHIMQSDCIAASCIHSVTTITPSTEVFTTTILGNRHGLLCN